MNHFEILIPLIFLLFGFAIAFFLRKSINILVVGILFFGIFKLLERLNFPTDWNQLGRLVDLLREVGNTIGVLVINILEVSSTASIFLFLVGGMSGLIVKRKSV